MIIILVGKVTTSISNKKESFSKDFGTDIPSKVQVIASISISIRK